MNSKKTRFQKSHAWAPLIYQLLCLFKSNKDMFMLLIFEYHYSFFMVFVIYCLQSVLGVQIH